MFNNGYALLIGVDENKDARLALPVVKKDVQKLESVITHPERCGYVKDHVRTLTGTDATRNNIFDGLEWLKQQLESDKSGNETALIFYSGHGHRSKAGDAYILPYDFRLPVEAGGVPANVFAQVIADIQPRRLLVILDCCHAEGMDVKGELEGPPITPTALTPDSPVLSVLAQGDGRAILSSSRGDQKSWIRNDSAMSVFTYHLVEALTGHTGRPEEPEVLVTEVMDYVARKVPVTAKSERSAIQEPIFNFKGTAFPVALVLGGKGSKGPADAPDALEALPKVVISNLELDEVSGKAKNLSVKKVTGGTRIESTAKVKTVKEGGEFTNTEIDEL